jgi:RNA polymerase sigma-70 factor (ECF subfamily)
MASYIAQETQTAEDQQFENDVLALIPALRAFAARYCRTSDEVDDLVQDTLFKAFRFRDKFQPGTALKSWLFTIMRHDFCSQYHVRKREPVTASEIIEPLLVTQPGQEWTIAVQDVTAAIDRLPQGVRDALMQASFGISYEEAAENCGCKLGTIKSRVGRARMHLAEEFEDLFSK